MSFLYRKKYWSSKCCNFMKKTIQFFWDCFKKWSLYFHLYFLQKCFRIRKQDGKFKWDLNLKNFANLYDSMELQKLLYMYLLYTYLYGFFWRSLCLCFFNVKTDSLYNSPHNISTSWHKYLTSRNCRVEGEGERK